MSVSITRYHCFVGLSDELAALTIPDKDGPPDFKAECSVRLLPRHSLSSPTDSGYEELFITRNRLVWSAHGRERMRIEAARTIVDAVLCPMVEDDASVPVLCVAEPTVLSIYTTEGDIHQHAATSPIKTLWTTPAGLVVEHHDHKPAQIVQNSITGLERLKAITSADPASSIQSWETEAVLFTSADTPYAITHDSSGQVLRIWCLKAFPEGSLQTTLEGGGSAKKLASLDEVQRTPAAMRSLRSQIRTPDDHIESFIFSQFRSQTIPGTGSTLGPSKVFLPTVNVQLAFELSFTDKVPQGAAEDACFLRSFSGAAHFAVRTSASQVLFFSLLSNGHVKRQGSLAGVRSIASLDLAGPRNGKGQAPERGLLSLDTEGALWIHMGMEKLLQIRIPPETPLSQEQVQYFPPARSSQLRSALGDRPVPESLFSQKCGETDCHQISDLGAAVDISHACGSYFLLHFAGGESIQVRVDMDRHIELVGKCMLALQAVMDPPEYRSMLHEYYRDVHPVGHEETDWKQFQAFIIKFWKSLISAQAEPMDHSSPSDQPGAEPHDAWQALLELDETQTLLNSRLYPAFAALVTPAVAVALPDDEMSSSSLPELQGDLRSSLADMIGALHSVFEDLMLDQMLWRHLPHLASLLATLASMLGQQPWKDYYWKHLQAAARLDLLPCKLQPIASLAPSLPPPADLQSALLDLVDCAPVDQSHALQLPLLVKRREDVVQRSIDILRIFHVLKHMLEDLSAQRVEENSDQAQMAAVYRHGSLEILHLLGELKWGLMDIDCLPFGIALPIHDALQTLREDPPADLSPAKYILLGREDMAATVLCMADAQKSSADPAALTPLQDEESGVSTLDSSPGGTLHTPHLHMHSPSGFSATTGNSMFTSPASLHGAAQGMPVWPCSPAGTPVYPAVGSQLLEQWSSRFVLGPISAQRLGMPGSDVSATDAEPEEQDSRHTDRAATEDPSLNDLNAQFYRMRFGRDLRLSEALHVLSFSRHVQLPSLATPDAAAQVQAKLASHAARTLALPIGRGALTLNTVNLLPTEPLQAHKIILNGRMPNKNNAVATLDMTAMAAAPCGGAENEMTAWPEFHSGVAAALRVIPSSSNLIRYWLLFKKPPTPTYEHAGMLFSLGLSGELKSLSSPNQYRYLCQEHTAIMVGLLIGLAASHRGSMDEATSRTLNMHIPARHQSVFGELEIAPLTQASAMVGLGLLYEGSGHQDTSEMLLHEIVRRPSSSQAGNSGGPNTGTDVNAVTVNQDREAYTLAAGFALGLINIGKGRWSSGVSNGSIAETLRRLIVGGAWASTVQPMALWQADQWPSKILNDDSAPSHGLSQVVLEGSLVNLEVTSPAATLALTLMFLKTNDCTVADMLVLPDTTFNLDFIRPSDILLRVVARSLIMWDSIKPTQEWVMQQMPQVIRMRWPESLEEIKAAVAEGREFDHEAVLLAHIHAVAGACLALGLRYAGTAVEEARSTLQAMILYFLQCRKTLSDIKATVEGFSIDSIIVERMAAVCAMALGSVMSGMGDLKTFKLLRALRKRLNLSDIPISSASAATVSRGFGVHMAIGMSIGFLFLGGACYKFNTSNKSVAMLLISMWPALPSSPSDNRCHLQALRHLYTLACNKRVMRAIDVNIRQPVYVPVTLSMTTDDHSAPQLSQTDMGDENRSSNLQLSHPMSSQPEDDKAATEVWSMKQDEVSPEQLNSPYPGHYMEEHRSIGLDGLPTCGHTPAGPTLASAKQLTLTERLCPCLMPEPNLLRAVEVGGSRYWPQKIDASKHGVLMQALCDRAALFVKKRAHALAYQDDPTGVRSLLSTLVSPTGLSSQSAPGSYDLLHICATFSTDPVITSFGLAFCQRNQSGQERAVPANTSETVRDGSFLLGLLSEGVMHETAHLLPMHLNIFYSFQALGASPVLEQEHQPRRFRFSNDSPSAVPIPTMADITAALTGDYSMPGSPMSEDTQSSVAEESLQLDVQSTVGWGFGSVATCAGPMQIVRNLKIADAYSCHAALRIAPGLSHSTQTHVVDPVFLQSCRSQLKQVWATLMSSSDPDGRCQQQEQAMPGQLLREALSSNRSLSPLDFTSTEGAMVADRCWIAAMVPLYLAHHNADASAHAKAQIVDFVRQLHEMMPDSDEMVAQVLSYAMDLPLAVSEGFVT